jgi:endonuclease/exonuclease/phosphatase (EEP) superfamily protein YafD
MSEAGGAYLLMYDSAGDVDEDADEDEDEHAGAQTPPAWQRIAWWLAVLAAIGFVLVIAASVVPVWPFELLEHFRVQLAVTGLVIVVGCGLLRMRGFFDVAAISWLVNACVLTTGLLPRSTTASVDASNAVRVRVLVLNVHTSSSTFDQVARLIRDVDPDVLGLVEVDRRWLDALAPTLEPFARIEKPRSDNFGIALYARGELTGAVEVLGGDVPSIVGEVEVRGARLSVIVTHPIPPVTRSLAAELDAQLVRVGQRARQLASPVIVMGDLNTTPWSRAFATLRKTSGLCDTRDGLGIQPTFPSSSWIVRIPIDHVLVSCSVGVLARRVERDVGSDHLPVVVDLGVPRG